MFRTDLSFEMSKDRTPPTSLSGGDYSLFKPEPEARITKYIDVLIRVSQHHALLSFGTTSLLNNIRLAVLHAAHEARSAEFERITFIERWLIIMWVQIGTK